jgi:hypothetical protein
MHCWLQVYFDSNGVIVAARVTKYLLEKSRVAVPLPNERNYHLFYNMCGLAHARTPACARTHHLFDSLSTHAHRHAFEWTDGWIHTRGSMYLYLYARDGNARTLRRFKGLPVHNKPLYSSLGLTSVEDYDYCTRGGCTEVLTVASLA